MWNDWTERQYDVETMFYARFSWAAVWSQYTVNSASFWFFVKTQGTQLPRTAAPNRFVIHLSSEGSTELISSPTETNDAHQIWCQTALMRQQHQPTNSITYMPAVIRRVLSTIIANNILIFSHYRAIADKRSKTKCHLLRSLHVSHAIDDNTRQCHVMHSQHVAHKLHNKLYTLFNRQQYNIYKPREKTQNDANHLHSVIEAGRSSHVTHTLKRDITSRVLPARSCKCWCCPCRTERSRFGEASWSSPTWNMHWWCAVWFERPTALETRRCNNYNSDQCWRNTSIYTTRHLHNAS